MADTKKPDEKTADPTPAPPDPEGDLSLSDEQLDKIAGGLAQLRFERPRALPISDSR